MFCSKCGKELQDDAKFCISCGTPVAPTAEAPAEAPLPEAPIPVVPEIAPGTPDFTGAPKKRISTVWLVLIIVGALFIMLIIGTAITIPVFVNGQKGAQKRTCQSNLRTVDSAIMMYVAESPEELYPESMQDLVDADVMMSIPTCPAGDRPYEWVEPGIGQQPYISCPNEADHTI